MATPEYTHRQVLQRAFDAIRNALRVFVINDAGSPIPVVVTTGSAGVPWFEDFEGAHPAGVGPHTILSMTVPVSKTRSLTRLQVSCRQESVWTVTQNGTVVGTLRTGAAQPSDSFEWNPVRAAAAGDIIDVVLTKRSGTADTDVAAHLMGVES